MTLLSVRFSLLMMSDSPDALPGGSLAATTAVVNARKARKQTQTRSCIARRRPAPSMLIGCIQSFLDNVRDVVLLDRSELGQQACAPLQRPHLNNMPNFYCQATDNTKVYLNTMVVCASLCRAFSLMA